jgi:hypothetical protein
LTEGHDNYAANFNVGRNPLLGFGTDIEVIGPEELRREIIDRARKVYELYCKPARRRRGVGISALPST